MKFNFATVYRYAGEVLRGMFHTTVVSPILVGAAIFIGIAVKVISVAFMYGFNLFF